MRKTLTLVLLLLGGCASDKLLLKGSGIESPPMEAAVRLCIEHPQLEICKPDVRP